MKVTVQSSDEHLVPGHNLLIKGDSPELSLVIVTERGVSVTTRIDIRADTIEGRYANANFRLEVRVPFSGPPVTFTGSGTSAYDGFGDSMDLNGGSIIVGAPTAKGFEPNSFVGAAYVFELIDGEWVLVGSLSPNEQNDFFYFGWDVSIDGHSAVVSAPEEPYGNLGHAGAVHVFNNTDGFWYETSTLTSPEPSVEAHFGSAVAIRRDIIAVGAPGGHSTGIPGKVFVYGRQGEAWRLTATLSGPRGKEAGFGSAIALSGDSLLVGAPADGAAYVYSRIQTATGESWRLDSRLSPSGEPNPGSIGFAASVAIYDDLAVVGSPLSTVDGGERAGAVHVFQNGPSGWSHVERLTASDATPFSYFGSEVGSGRDYIIVGAPLHQFEETYELSHPGSAYIFSKYADSWLQANQLVLTKLHNVRFGNEVAIADGIAVVTSKSASANISVFTAGIQ